MSRHRLFHGRREVRPLVLAAVSAAPLLLQSTARADSFNWIDGQDSWFAPNKWIGFIGFGTPTAADDARIFNGGTVLVNSASDSATASALLLGPSAGFTGAAIVSAGTLTTSSDLRVGGDIGSLYQRGRLIADHRLGLIRPDID